MNSKGQSLIETVFALPFLLSLLLGIISLFFLTLAYFFCQYHVHEYAFCQISYSDSHCYSLLYKQIQRNPLIQISKIQKNKNLNHLNIQASFKLKGFPEFKDFQIYKEVDLNQWH
jgi:hypothetical protein